MNATKKPEASAVSIAVVDDDPAMGEQIGALVADIDGCSVRVFQGAIDCLAHMSETPIDIVITDVNMPGMGGMELLKKIKADDASTEVIVVTAYGDKELAIEALRCGAFDFLEKPFKRDELNETVKRTVRYRQALQERDRLTAQVSFLSTLDTQHCGVESFVGESAALRRIIEDIRLLDASPNTPVLVLGESGTGKELVARAIHARSARARKPFIAVNCASVTAELAESALFGHVKGAFTGASGDRKGFFEMADGGTIFLDEIGDMPAHLQVKLLRVLEDSVVVPVGRGTGRRVDVRVIAATNADLRSRVSSGTFRLDLFHRLAGFVIEIPPLRERPDDIPPLARHFVQHFASEMGRNPPEIAADALEIMAAHTFTGNVRELRNVVERALMESRGRTIEACHLHFQGYLEAVKRVVKESPIPSKPDDSANIAVPLNIKEAEHILVKKALALTNNNMAAAARLLGINRTSLYRRLVKIHA